MKICAILVFLLTIAHGSAAHAADPQHDVFPICVAGKWGYIDAKAKIVIEPQFEAAHLFSEGLAVAKQDGKYGYIDKAGAWVIPPQFKYAFGFSESLAWINGLQGPNGFIDKSGKIVVTPPPMTFAHEYRDGLAMMRPVINDRFQPTTQPLIGFINKRGEPVIEASFDEAWDFAGGLAAVKLNGKWGFIDAQGKFVIGPRYDSASYFSEDVAAVKLNGKTRFINRSGNVAVSGEFEDAHGFREGLCGASRDGKWGFIDKTGRFVIEPKYDDVSSFFNERSSFTMNGKQGVIDKAGKVIVEPTYAYIHFFLGELAAVSNDLRDSDGSGYGYINRAGEVVWQPKPAPTTNPSAVP